MQAETQRDAEKREWKNRSLATLNTHKAMCKTVQVEGGSTVQISLTEDLTECLQEPESREERRDANKTRRKNGFAKTAVYGSEGPEIAVCGVIGINCRKLPFWDADF